MNILIIVLISDDYVFFSFVFSCFFFLIEVYLFEGLCQFLLCSKVNQQYAHIHPLSFGFTYCSGHHRALSRGPCALQHVLTSCLSYTQYQQCICVNPSFPVHPTALPSLVSVPLFSMSVSLFLLWKIMFNFKTLYFRSRRMRIGKAKHNFIDEAFYPLNAM